MRKNCQRWRCIPTGQLHKLYVHLFTPSLMILYLPIWYSYLDKQYPCNIFVRALANLKEIGWCNESCILMIFTWYIGTQACLYVVVMYAPGDIWFLYRYIHVDEIQRNHIIQPIDTHSWTCWCCQWLQLELYQI